MGLKRKIGTTSGGTQAEPEKVAVAQPEIRISHDQAAERQRETEKPREQRDRGDSQKGRAKKKIT